MSRAVRSGLRSCATAVVLTFLAVSAGAEGTALGIPIQVGGSGRPVVRLRGYVVTAVLVGRWVVARTRELENAAHHIDTMVRGDPAKQADDAVLRAELQLLRDALFALVARLRSALGRRGKPAT